jgi:cyclic pyranopterin phosphate synthase
MDRIDRFTEGISIDIGLSCNNNCIFCVNQRDDSKCKDLSTDEVKNMMREVKKFFDGIFINGGEPTIRKDIIELIYYAKDLGFKAIMMISNGRMFSYDKFCKKLYNAGLRLVFVTLQATTADLHDAMTKVKGSFEQTINGIKNLKKYGIEVYTNTVINKLNYKDLPELPFLLSKLNVQYCKLSFVRIKGNAQKNRDWIVPRISEVVPYVRLAAENFIKLKMDFIIQEIPACVMKTHIQYLRKGKKMPYIDPNHPKADEFLKKYGREGNIKLNQCRKCLYDNGCLGPWEEYIRYFGDSEFKPIIK